MTAPLSIDRHFKMSARLPLLLLLLAVAARAVGEGLAGVHGASTLGYLMGGGGGGLLLFLFPTFSVLYRRRPAGAEALGVTLVLCALINPLLLVLGGELMVLVGIAHTPMRMLALCVLPTLALEWGLRRESPTGDRTRGDVALLVLPALTMVMAVAVSPRTHRIHESHLLPDQTHEQLAALDPGTGVAADLRREPPSGQVLEMTVSGTYAQRWVNPSMDRREVELRWLLHNDGPDEQDVSLWVDGQVRARHRVPARFDPSRHPRDYPPSNALAVVTFELAPGEHTVLLRQAPGANPLIVLDLTGLPRDDAIQELQTRFQIVDVGDVQQVLDIARNFDTNLLPRVGNRGQALQFVGGGVTVVDLPLYHLVLNLALNLVSDDLAGANALFVWLLGWTLLGLLLLFDPGRAGGPGAWILAALLTVAVASTIWRLLPPNDEALFLDAYMTLAGVALVMLAGRRCLLGGAVAAVVIAGTMRAGQLWMVLSALGFLALSRSQWPVALRLFGPAVVVSVIVWLAIALGASNPALSSAFGDVLAEDVADRFLYFTADRETVKFLRPLWVAHTSQFVGFCLAGSGGLLLLGLGARSRLTSALTAGLMLYLIALAVLAHHRVAYTVPFIVVGIAVGLAALREPRDGDGPRQARWKRVVVVAATLLVTANAGRLMTTTDDYTQTEGARVLWYATYPGESARWLALRAVGELERGHPDQAHSLLMRALTLYPYHLPHVSYHLGRVALARERPGEAAEIFGMAARLEEGACVRTRGGALLMASAGELELALDVMRQNLACAEVSGDDGFPDLLARLASGAQSAEPHLRDLPGDLDLRNCYLTEAYGWPFDIPPTVPLPPR